MKWSYPGQDSDPWFDQFESFVESVDSSSYASREDRNVLITGGGSVSFVNGELSWSSPIDVLSPISGFKVHIANGSAEIEIGDSLYIDLTRNPLGSQQSSVLTAKSVPNTDSAFLIARRVDDFVYFRNGSRIKDGESKTLFEGSDAGFEVDEKLVNTIKIAGRDTHNSELQKVSGAVAFNPSDYKYKNFSRQILFRAIAANGDSGIVTNVKLINLTDSDDITTLSFTSQSIQKDETILTVGDDSGELPDGERIYEVRTSLEEEPDGDSETAELYSAEIRVVNKPL